MDRNYKLYKHISPSGKVYIGITKQEPKNRWKNGKGYKDNDYFTNAINKYGWDNFQHEILFNNLTKAEAKLLEQCYIALYDTTNRDKGYNITLGGESANGLKHTEEWKKELSNKYTGEGNPNYGKGDKIRGENNPLYGKHLSEETKKKLSEAHKGKKISEQTKKKMSEAQTGEKNHNYGKPLSKEQRKAISKANSKMIKNIETGEVFSSITKAAEKYKVGKTSICNALKNGYKSAGYHWEYII